MDFLESQIPPPKSWDLFEEICRALFAEIWKDPQTKRHGRTGQPQHGVDVYGSNPENLGGYLGVQCKGKTRNYRKKATSGEFDRELAKAEKFTPYLMGWTFATSAPDDATLQEHVRAVSEKRQAAGKFPVDIVGWDTLQSMIAGREGVIQQFYPEYGDKLDKVLARMDTLPTDVASLLSRPATVSDQSPWGVELFDASRDLGPALLGRALGAADVVACPEVQEVSRLWAELERAYFARLAATPGTGKSVCTLQVAKRAHARGWRVLRLRNPETTSFTLLDDGLPTIYIIDDAHLVDSALLKRIEEQAAATRWVLSAHTLFDDKVTTPGTLRLNGKRAVSDIAAALRKNLAETEVMVQKIDSRIGHRIGDEAITDRLKAAEGAERPWQFCFILSGGWQRAASTAEAANAAGADLVLVAAAIRQIASRDARCSREDLEVFLVAADVNPATVASSTSWLVGERHLLADDDLRCPHQRLASVLIKRILELQDESGRVSIGAMIKRVLSEDHYPLPGLNILLQELRFDSKFAWSKLVSEDWLTTSVRRCWAADGEERAGAAWFLSELQVYIGGWPKTVLEGNEGTLSRWFDDAVPGTGYAIGHLLGQVGMRDEELVSAIMSRTHPTEIAVKLNHAAIPLAAEIASMVFHSWRFQSDEWKAQFCTGIDRDACLEKMRNWPKDLYLSAASDYCRLFSWIENDFGLDLVEAWLPAISDQLSVSPFYSFHEMGDIIWHCLHLNDILGIYSDRPPSERMRNIAGKIVEVWSDDDLSAKLSNVARRDFQTAAHLLSFIEEVSREKFDAVVSRVDFDRINATIGNIWPSLGHEGEILLRICQLNATAKPKIQALIRQNLEEMSDLAPRLAMLAPEATIEILDSGRQVALSGYGYFAWLEAFVSMIQFAEARPDLISKMMAPHEAAAASDLSKPQQPFFGNPLPCLRFLWQIAPEVFDRILSGIVPSTARTGWARALEGAEGHQHDTPSLRKSHRIDRHTAAWLIERAVVRPDALGEMARSLRQKYGEISVPPPHLLKRLRRENDN